MCRGKIFLGFGTEFQREVPLFWWYLNSIKTQHKDKLKERFMPQTISVCSAAVSIQYRLVTDRHRAIAYTALAQHHVGKNSFTARVCDSHRQNPASLWTSHYTPLWNVWHFLPSSQCPEFLCQPVDHVTVYSMDVSCLLVILLAACLAESITQQSGVFSSICLFILFFRMLTKLWLVLQCFVPSVLWRC